MVRGILYNTRLPRPHDRVLIHVWSEFGRRAQNRMPLSDDDIANIDETLQLDGRIEKDDWIEQAQNLVAEAAVAEVPAEEEAQKG